MEGIDDYCTEKVGNWEAPLSCPLLGGLVLSRWLQVRDTVLPPNLLIWTLDNKMPLGRMPNLASARFIVDPQG